MRKKVRDQIVELLPTIWDGIKYAQHAQPHQAVAVLEDCGAAFESILNGLESGLTEERFHFYRGIITELTTLLDLINKNIDINQPVSDAVKRFKNWLDVLKKELMKESEVKLEIVFMPYKSSMWDSLESIWLAAREDERCNATVVPIPYYDRNSDRTFGALHYEGEDYPDYVPVVHYDDYDLGSQPDVIYIHNPYDEYNLVTSVDPRFYSHNLKKFTDKLVYVPYFISGAYANVQVFAQKHLVSCVKHVDKIVVQSNTHKKLYIDSGVKESKLLALGSPKFDTVATLNRHISDVSADWMQKINGKKTIVLNSSIGSLLSDPEYLVTLRQRISTILSYDELFLIWRPHPLLETTITSMRPDLRASYGDLLNMVHITGRALMDQSTSTISAMIAADGMISDSSSWARQYMATGKPILMLNGASAVRKDRICVFDHFSCYFLRDGFSIDDFCNMLLKGEDPQKEARMADLRKYVVNNDGTCGQKIHKSIVGSLG